MEAYDWPGNIRELKNVIERAVILSPGNTLRLDLSLPESTAAGRPHASEAGPETVLTERQMREFRKQNIVAALKQTQWRVPGKGGAAELLAIKPTTLADRIKSLRIRRPGR